MVIRYTILLEGLKAPKHYARLLRMSQNISIRQAKPEEDDLLADNFYLMWQAYDMHKLVAENWKEQTLAFIKEARAQHKLTSFVAEQDGVVVGSASCQLFQGLYPVVFQEDKRKYGYIWAVYVAPEARKQGLASKLTQACNDYLKAIGCTKVLLHAAPMGKSVYEKLGFITSNEMILELR